MHIACADGQTYLSSRRDRRQRSHARGDLDRADGINLILLEQIVRVFERANEQDPTIPRLVPIATRRLFSRSTRKKATETPGGGGGAAGSGSAGSGSTGGAPPDEEDPLENDDAPV
ncbi:hypothetical protein [Sorangium sp. So ce381]|uniref:hypothetical protein n=1 Tax=Sorangium sp. So ce381 TaxID=3133307 RepID=UPI003F5B1E8D